MKVDTIKTADYGYIQLYGYKPKSVTTGLDCDDSAAEGHMRKLWPYLFLVINIYTVAQKVSPCSTINNSY